MIRLLAIDNEWILVKPAALQKLNVRYVYRRRPHMEQANSVREIVPLHITETIEEQQRTKFHYRTRK